MDIWADTLKLVCGHDDPERVTVSQWLKIETALTLALGNQEASSNE